MERVTLPPADWRRRDDLDRLVETLGEARFVGGAVRDTLLGLPVADVDLATPLPPETVLKRLSDAGLRAVPTGIEHGTVTAVLASGPVEVTTLRRDLTTDGRRATVAYTDDWREDAARRDFTINALYADPRTGAIFDYFDGLADLDARHIRFIGDPLRRIAEDHLRILRFFRFLARFGDSPDPQGLEACAARARDLMALSRERIADELLKLLVARDAVRVLRLMIERAILVPVLPEITAPSIDRLADLVASEEAASVAPDPIRRLAALLPPEPQLADAIGARLKLSNARRKRLGLAVSPLSETVPAALAYRIGTESAVDRLLLAREPAAAAAIEGQDVPRLPLTGGALVARGLSKGPEVARVLRAIEDQWVAESFPDQARVEALADALVAQALRASSNA